MKVALEMVELIRELLMKVTFRAVTLLIRVAFIETLLNVTFLNVILAI